MDVILVTSRLTLWTSSSVSCVRRSALLCSPRITSSIAAFRSVDMPSSCLVVVFRIIGGASGPASNLFLADPGAQDLRRDIRILLHLLAQMLGEHLGGLGDHGRQPQGVERLRLHLALHGFTL